MMWSVLISFPCILVGILALNNNNKKTNLFEDKSFDYFQLVLKV